MSVLFYVPEKNKSHKRHESKQIMTEYIFFGWTNFLNIQYRIT